MWRINLQCHRFHELSWIHLVMTTCEKIPNLERHVVITTDRMFKKCLLLYWSFTLLSQLLMNAELITHQIPLETVIVYVFNNEDVGGDEYWFVVFFIDLFEFLENGAAPFGKSPVQIFSNHLFHGINFMGTCGSGFKA